MPRELRRWRKCVYKWRRDVEQFINQLCDDFFCLFVKISKKWNKNGREEEEMQKHKWQTRESADECKLKKLSRSVGE